MKKVCLVKKSECPTLLASLCESLSDWIVFILYLLKRANEISLEPDNYTFHL